MYWQRYSRTAKGPGQVLRVVVFVAVLLEVLELRSSSPTPWT